MVTPIKELAPHRSAAESGTHSRHPPVNSYLFFLVLACLIPGIIGAMALVSRHNQSSREALEQSSIQTARALMQTVDSQLAKDQAVLQGLLTSDAVRKHDFPALYRRMRQISSNPQLASRFSLLDREGQLIFNTDWPLGAKLPKTGNLPHLLKIIESRQPAVSNLFKGGITGKLMVTVDVPVVVDDEVEFVLSATLRPSVFNTILTKQALPADWLAGVLDREGNIVTRIPDTEKYIGTKMGGQFVKEMQGHDEGAFESVSVEGIAILAVYSRSPITGWTTVLGIPLHPLEAEYKKPIYTLVGSVSALFVLVAALAWWVSQRIALSIRALVEPAQKLGQGERVPLADVHIREADEVAHALLDASNILHQRTEALDAEKNSRLTQLEQMVAERTEALEAATKAAEKLARRDALSGLFNRLAANERLQEEFLRMKRTGNTYSALLIDVDHFKQVNDTYGHETGDHVLKMVAELLVKSARATDFAFRFGGEEFLLLLPETPLAGAQVMAEKIRSTVEAQLFASWLQVTVSIGASVARPEDVNDHEVVRRADSALYMAKNAGRNQVKCS